MRGLGTLAGYTDRLRLRSITTNHVGGRMYPCKLKAVCFVFSHSAHRRSGTLVDKLEVVNVSVLTVDNDAWACKCHITA